MANEGQPFNVPEDMRKMLDHGVNQTREGFVKVMEAATEAVGTLEQKADAAQVQATDLRKKAMSFTETHVTAALDLASNLVKAKSFDEVMKLQSDYMAHQISTLRAHAEDAGESLKEHAKAVADDFVAQAQTLQTKAEDALEQSLAAAKEAAETATEALKKGR